MINLKQLLSSAVKENSSDIYISAGYPPAFKINNKLIKAKTEKLSSEDAKSICFEVLSEKEKQMFREGKKVVTAFTGPDGYRFRLSLYNTEQGVSGAFRKLLLELPVLKDLNLPSSFKSVLNLQSGLVLFSGPASSGKTTTLSAIIDYTNRNHRYSIVTIENPVEYIFTNGKGLLTQLNSVKSGVIEHLSPKIVLIRNIKNIKNLKKAIELVNSGCLVYGEVNSASSVGAIELLRNSLKNKEQLHLEGQLLSSLKAVVSQRLVASAKKTLVPVSEVMFLDKEIRKAILLDDIERAAELIRLDHENLGNFSFNQALMNDVIKRKIDVKQAFLASPKPEELDSMLNKAGF